MRKGSLFILQQDVQKHKAGHQSRESESQSYSSSTELRSGFFDDHNAIQLEYPEAPVEAAFSMFNEQLEETDEQPSQMAAQVFESLDLSDDFSDVIDDNIEDQMDEFFDAGKEKFSDQRDQLMDSMSEEPAEPPSQRPQSESKSVEDLNPIDPNDPHRMFEEISNNMTRNKAISLGDFSLEQTFEAFDENQNDIISEDELNQDFELMNGQDENDKQ